MRQRLFQSLAILILILFSIFLYDHGKMHTLLPENKTIEIDGKTYKAFSSITLSIDGQEELELYPRDRLKAKVKGRNHKLKMTAYTRSGEEIVIEKKFKISHKDSMYLLSLPALGAENPQWLSPFSPK